MSIKAYLESEPLSEISIYHGGNRQDSVAFVGTLRKHPYDEDKLLLISNPGESEPGIYEFRVGDVAGAEELPSPVDQSGKSRNLARLWVKKGSFGIRYEPFEVDDKIWKGAGSSVSPDMHAGLHTQSKGFGR
jgi:inorganic pyrophosphatase